MVGDGVQALLWLAEHRADLIITDLLMPNMDGRALMRELARQNIDTPVIAMSGGQRANPQAFNEELAQQLGFRTFLKKPFTRVALRRAVELALGKKLCPQQST
jgi:two-component system response regulator GlrR